MAENLRNGRGASGKPSPIIANLVLFDESVELKLDVERDPVAGLVLVQLVRAGGALLPARLMFGSVPALDLALRLTRMAMRLRGPRMTKMKARLDNPPSWVTIEQHLNSARGLLLAYCRDRETRERGVPDLDALAYLTRYRAMLDRNIARLEAARSVVNVPTIELPPRRRAATTVLLWLLVGVCAAGLLGAVVNVALFDDLYARLASAHPQT
jgi:hypothetical protein